MRKAADKKVRESETGMEYKTPSSPKNKGRIKANPTPNTTSRIMDRAVEAAAFPMACKNKHRVHNIVKRSHQQGDHAGNRILSHQLSNTLRPQKLI